jgi:hypothetical protein
MPTTKLYYPAILFTSASHTPQLGYLLPVRVQNAQYHFHDSWQCRPRLIFRPTFARVNLTILPEAGYLTSRSCLKLYLQGLFSIQKGRIWVFKPSSTLPLCSPGRHLTQLSKLGRDVKSEAIDWTYLTINSNVPSAACPNFASRFEDAEVIIPVCHYAKPRSR